MLKNPEKQMAMKKPLLRALEGKSNHQPPVWLMRQAGRYLPEYRALREKAGSFLKLAFSPEMAAEITLQPIRRYGMDAAILFSDILTVPMMLGQKVDFVEGEGPVLSPVRTSAEIPVLIERTFEDTVAPIAETVERVRGLLNQEGFSQTALIGFAGAPWTVACYMVEGSSSRDYAAAKKWAYTDPEGFSRLIAEISEATVLYLERQVAAGAEALQLFDSWAGVLDEMQFRRWVIEPAKYIAQRLRISCPHVPLIGFPRGAGALYFDYALETGVQGVSIDSGAPLRWTADVLQKNVTVQGNLDPVCLLAGGKALESAAEKILDNLSAGPFIFNLGHGVIKETPPEHVEKLVTIIRSR